MSAFLSTYVNKVDRKKRVSVPAPYRAALSNANATGLIAYASLKAPAIEVLSRNMLDRLSSQHVDQSLDGGDFEQLLLGDGDSLLETVMAMVHELPLDTEGRTVLPAALAEHAGIEDQASFVGRGNRFQIWSPETFHSHQQATIGRLRERLSESGLS